MEFPFELVYSWTPGYRDSDIIRRRIQERLLTPLKAKPGFHKYYGKPFANKMLNSNLYWVWVENLMLHSQKYIRMTYKFLKRNLEMLENKDNLW